MLKRSRICPKGPEFPTFLGPGPECWKFLKRTFFWDTLYLPMRIDADIRIIRHMSDIARYMRIMRILMRISASAWPSLNSTQLLGQYVLKKNFMFCITNIIKNTGFKQCRKFCCWGDHWSQTSCLILKFRSSDEVCPLCLQRAAYQVSLMIVMIMIFNLAFQVDA